MKIDTSNPRLPINRLKRPLTQRTMPSEEPEDTSDESAFADTFERQLLQNGARRFKEWVEKIEIK